MKETYEERREDNLNRPYLSFLEYLARWKILEIKDEREGKRKNVLKSTIVVHEGKRSGSKQLYLNEHIMEKINK